MNKYTLLLLCSVNVNVAAEQLHQPHLYLGAFLGQAHGEVGAQQINNRMADLGYAAESEVDGQNRLGWAIYGGYQWTRQIAIEVGYTDLGEVQTRLTGAAADIRNYLNSANLIHPRTAEGFLAALQGRHIFSPGGYLFARAGLFYSRSHYQANALEQRATRYDQDGTLFWGVGYSHPIYDQLTARIQFERYSVEGETISLMGLGVSIAVNSH